MTLVGHKLNYTLGSLSLPTAPRTRYTNHEQAMPNIYLISNSDMHIIFHINVYNFNVFYLKFFGGGLFVEMIRSSRIQSSGLQRKSAEPKPPGSRHYGLCKNSTNQADQPDNQLLLSVIIIIPMLGGPEGLEAHHRFNGVPSWSAINQRSMTHNSCL